MTTGLPRRLLEPCLGLLLSGGPAHGYDLAQRLGEVGLERIDLSTLYRVLRSMDKAGLVESEWEASDVGPGRRTYRLTEQGRAHLDRDAHELRAAAGVMASCVARYERSRDEVGS